MKFTVITPESLEMSRLIMSVVSVAMGDEQQQASDSGSNSVSGNSIVSNSFYQWEAEFTSYQSLISAISIYLSNV